MGAEGSYRATDYIGGRVGFNMFGTSLSVNSGNVKYSTDINLATFGGTFDVYPLAHSPWGGGFRVSAGLKWNGNSLDLTATPVNGAKINGTSYPGAQLGTIKGTLDFEPISPYVGIGYAGRVYGGFELGIDIGALYQGRGNLNLTASGIAATTPGLQADLKKEEDKIISKVSLLDFYPVLEVTAKYRF